MTSNQVRLARIALSRICEPGDTLAYLLVQTLGPVAAIEIITRERDLNQAEQNSLAAHAQSVGYRGPGIRVAQERWKPRCRHVAPERELRSICGLGGGTIIPEDPEWPQALNDLGTSTPFVLWYRGNLEYRGEPRMPPIEKCIALVGSRDSTNYGESVTAQLTYDLVSRGYTVISGGAYGIDASAHQAALRATPQEGTPPTVGLMAGGLDRFYPAGNEDLLRQVVKQGCLFSEVPPGSNPTKYRFLYRNRLIAALSCSVVVVEARWRSGALNTAHHAAELGREVAVVPGSVFSASSSGTHRLLREGAACVTSAEDIIELVSGEQAARESVRVHEPESLREYDGLPPEDILLMDALPKTRGSEVSKLAQVAGLSEQMVRAGLSRLELLGLACRHNTGWKRDKLKP